MLGLSRTTGFRGTVMNRTYYPLLGSLFALLLLAEPAAAALLGGAIDRGRVIQFCMVVVIIALFVMIKKFSDR